MPTPTYTLIEAVTLATSASSVTFSSIPTDGTYRDLVLVSSAKSDTVGYSIRGQINGDTGSNYNRVTMYGTGSGTGSGTTASFYALAFSASGNLSTVNFDLMKIEFMDYSATKHKAVLSRSQNSDASFSSVDAVAHRWASTSAITSVSLFLSGAGNNFVAGSTFSLYGIAG